MRIILDVVILALSMVLSGMAGIRAGYAEGSVDTAGRWSSVTDRCIAKLESAIVIARAGDKRQR